MKTKLLELKLPETVVNQILDAYSTYQQTLSVYSKPKGKMEFDDNLKELNSLSKKILKKLEKLTDFEFQLLSYHNPLGLNIRNLKNEIYYLSLACDHAEKMDTGQSFSRKEPFVRQLTIELWEVLEKNGISISIYRDHVICKILNILLDVDKHSEKSLHLVREVSERMKKQEVTP